MLRRWAWFCDISPHLFRLGETYTSVDSAYSAATTEPTPPPAGAVSIIRGPRMLSCDGQTTDVIVPRGATVMLEFAAPPSGPASTLAVDGRWLPAETTRCGEP